MSRESVVEAAVAELGKPNLPEYWADALGKPTTKAPKLAWCGVFALYCLHKAGLLLHVHWEYGMGFLTTPDRKWLLPKTQAPKPGDIGYRDQPFQHHFAVESVDGSRVHSVDGNSGAHSTVNRATHSLGNGRVYFSIASLVGEVELPSPSQPPKPWAQPAAVQHATNSLIMKHLGDPMAPPPSLLTVDGIVGPRTTEALKWAQRVLGIPVTGNPDAATCNALGLS